MSKPRKLKITAGHVERALREHLNWMTTKIIIEANVPYMKLNSKGKRVHGAYRADYMCVNPIGYGTEIEVKVSMSDWKADLKKGKWGGMPDWVVRFIYLVPEHLGIPDWVPEQAGIWHLYQPPGSSGLKIKVARAPKRIGKTKVPVEIMERWMVNFYYRYWNLRNTRDRLLPSL